MIAAFARKCSLPVETIRFYVRRGLLHPQTGCKGGSRPYRMFSALDVERARVVRVGKALGLSLEEIGGFLESRTFDAAEEGIVLAFLAEQRNRLTTGISDLAKLVKFIDQKTAWLKDPGSGPPPALPG